MVSPTMTGRLQNCRSAARSVTMAQMEGGALTGEGIRGGTMCDDGDFYLSSTYYDSGQTRRPKPEAQPKRELADAYAGHRWLGISAVRRLWGWHKPHPERQSSVGT